MRANHIFLLLFVLIFVGCEKKVQLPNGYILVNNEGNRLVVDSARNVVLHPQIFGYAVFDEYFLAGGVRTEDRRIVRDTRLLQYYLLDTKSGDIYHLGDFDEMTQNIKNRFDVSEEQFRNTFREF